MKRRIFALLTFLMTQRQKEAAMHLVDWLGSWRYYLTRRYYWHGFSSHREPYMRLVAALEEKRLHRSLDILEIGSFRGHSAVLWSEFGNVTCVDDWERPLHFGIFKRNVRLAKTDRIQWIQGRSVDVLPTLSARSFDLIYVDGDHSYEGCRGDLLESLRLLRPGGIVCGDDLEFQAHELQGFNPTSYAKWSSGVTAAVAEWFGPVWCKDGFFAVRYNGERLEKQRFERYTLNGNQTSKEVGGLWRQSSPVRDTVGR